MKDININILVHQRAHFLDLTIMSLRDIVQKECVKINLLCTANKRRFNHQIIHAVQALTITHGIETKAIAFSKDAPYNFMDKIRWMCRQPEPYTIRVDDDCFAPAATWDMLIKQIDYLDADKYPILAIAPCVSNGIPTVDYFRKTFFTDQQKEEIDQLILQNPIFHKWTNDYSNLKPAFEKDQWNPDLYYRLLYENGDERLGIHPVRFTLGIQKRINEIILDNWDKFMSPPCKRASIVDQVARPYYCNTCFAIKTENYKKIIDDTSLVRDSFEEISFNLYRRKHNLLLMFLTDAWMLNMYFRSVGNLQLENELHNTIKQKYENL